MTTLIRPFTPATDVVPSSSVKKAGVPGVQTDLLQNPPTVPGDGVLKPVPLSPLVAPINAERLAGKPVRIITLDNDPLVEKYQIEELPISDFTLDAKGRPTGLVGPKVAIVTDKIIYSRGADGKFTPYLVNPWTEAKPNHDGNFTAPKEPRSLLLPVVRDAAGAPVKNADGLIEISEMTNIGGQTVAFDAGNTVHRLMELAAGRPLVWGDENGQMSIEPHAILEENAMFMASANAVIGGVALYRLPGDPKLYVFEMTSSWEVIAHECGHAIHHALKPNVRPGDVGFRQWGESFADQTEMWASAQDDKRIANTLKKSGGALNISNELSVIGEADAFIERFGVGIRDAYNNKTVAGTSDEVHDRSEVLTGACYQVFLYQVAKLRQAAIDAKLPDPGIDAIKQAAAMMQKFSALATNFVPENKVTLKDVALAYLTVDKEFFGGQFQAVLEKQFTSRGLLSAAIPANPDTLTDAVPSSLDQWKVRMAAMPALKLTDATLDGANALVQANAKALGIPDGFGIKAESIETDSYGYQIVRVALNRPNATGTTDDVDNQGIAVFRPDGTMVDFHSAWPFGLDAAQGIKLLDQAKAAGLDKKGTLGFTYVTDDNGNSSWTVQVIQQFPQTAPTGSTTGSTLKLTPELLANTYTVYDLEHPDGIQVPYADVPVGAGSRMREMLSSNLPDGATLVSKDGVPA